MVSNSVVHVGRPQQLVVGLRQDFLQDKDTVRNSMKLAAEDFLGRVRLKAAQNWGVYLAAAAETKRTNPSVREYVRYPRRRQLKPQEFGRLNAKPPNS